MPDVDRLPEDAAVTYPLHFLATMLLSESHSTLASILACRSSPSRLSFHSSALAHSHNARVSLAARAPRTSTLPSPVHPIPMSLCPKAAPPTRRPSPTRSRWQSLRLARWE